MTDDREQPKLCAHFGQCGGCRSQDVPYSDQLAQKAAALADTFREHWNEAIDVTPSPVIWHYRNKIELNFGRKHYPEPPPKDFVKETVLGFKKKGKWYWTLDLDECRIASPELPALLESIRAWHRDKGLRAYDSRRRDGSLRFLIVREGKRTGQRMIALITASSELETEPFVEAVRRAYPATSILWGVNPGRSEQAIADEVETLWGSSTIDEELRIARKNDTLALRFRLSPFSFFQTNTLATELLYQQIRAWCEAVAPRTLYDLYGGSGGIAFSCADLVETVQSVESWQQASIDGVHNATTNSIDNVRFTTAKVETYLKQVELDSGDMDADCAVVLDPPRAGLHPKALRRLIQLRPPRILYVSCKPTVLAQELDSLTQSYELTDLSAIDLFPHTPHIEALASLELK